MARITSILLGTLVAVPNFAYAEPSSAPTGFQAPAESEQEKPLFSRLEDAFKRGIRMNITKSGSSYAKLLFSMQTWARFIETNPGSISTATNEPINTYIDFGIRRARWMALVNFEDFLIFFAQIGITSFPRTAVCRNPFYIHDFQAQLQYHKGHYIGAGLHFWQGLSRASRIAHTDYLTLDNEGFNFPNVFIDDWVVRQMGVFARGSLGRLGYSATVNIPASASSQSNLYTDDQIAESAIDNLARLRRHTNANFRGYLYYSLLTKDKPLSSGAFKMTYHGNRGPMLNLGAGWQYQPEGIGYWDEATDQVKRQASLAVAGDIFLELPTPDDSVINAYATYYRFDFGPNYVRTQNVMGGYATSSSDGSGLLPGPGHIVHAWGTGDVFHAELGYILPRWLFRSQTRLQPFAALTVRQMEAFEEPSFMYHFGVNWLIVGRNMKVTAAYYNRPLYDPDTLKVVKNPATVVLQLQLRI